MRAFSRFARSTWARLSSEKVVGVLNVIRFVGRYTDDLDVYLYFPVSDFQFSANHLESPVRLGFGPIKVPPSFLYFCITRPLRYADGFMWIDFLTFSYKFGSVSLITFTCEFYFSTSIEVDDPKLTLIHPAFIVTKVDVFQEF